MSTAQDSLLLKEVLGEKGEALVYELRVLVKDDVQQNTDDILLFRLLTDVKGDVGVTQLHPLDDLGIALLTNFVRLDDLVLDRRRGGETLQIAVFVCGLLRRDGKLTIDLVELGKELSQPQVVLQAHHEEQNLNDLLLDVDHETIRLGVIVPWKVGLSIGLLLLSDPILEDLLLFFAHEVIRAVQQR